MALIPLGILAPSSSGAFLGQFPQYRPDVICRKRNAGERLVLATAAELLCMWQVAKSFSVPPQSPSRPFQLRSAASWLEGQFLHKEVDSRIHLESMKVVGIALQSHEQAAVGHVGRAGRREGGRTEVRSKHTVPNS